MSKRLGTWMLILAALVGLIVASAAMQKSGGPYFDPPSRWGNRTV